MRRDSRSIRGWIGYTARALLTGLFRFGVTALGALGVLSRRPTQSDELRILIVHLTPHLGDTILVMPLVAALRKAHPNARIEFAIEETAAPLLKRMPELDHVYALRLGQAPPVTPWQAMRRAMQVAGAYWKHMRDASPSVCLLPRWDNDQYRSSVLGYLTGAPRRVGFGWNAVPGAKAAAYRDRLLTEQVVGGSGLQEAMRFCLLASEAGLIPRAAVEEAGVRAVPALQRIAAAEDWPKLADRLGIDRARPFAVIAPGASMTRRIWPTENWVRVGHALEAMGFDLVILSGVSDRTIAEQLHEARGRRDVLAAGKTDLIESATVLQHASLFLGSDSGPGHLAGALGIPTVVLFVTAAGYNPDGVSSPERVRPVGPLVTCCCPPDSLPPCRGACTAETAHCITLIEPRAVMTAVTSVLQRTDHETQPTGSRS